MSTAYPASWIQVPEKHRRVQLGSNQSLLKTAEIFPIISTGIWHKPLMNPLGLPVACSAWLINIKIHPEHLTLQVAGLQVSLLVFPLQAAANRDRMKKRV